MKSGEPLLLIVILKAALFAERRISRFMLRQ